MTDPPPGRPATARSGTLGLRLALAFLGVALAAIALLAGLTAAFAAADVSNLATQQRGELARAIAVATGAVWDENKTWSTADLSPVLDLAAHTGTAVQIRDQSGRVVASSDNFSAAAGPQSNLPVTVRGGERVGTALVRSTGSGLNAADRSLKTALLRAIAGAAGLAALLALFTGLAVARRITRPVTRLIAVTRAMAAGDRTARVGEIHAAGELRELGASFDQMAGTLDRQEQIRRNLVADVAHELRTPIAILQAGHEALLDGVAEPTPAELGEVGRGPGQVEDGGVRGSQRLQVTHHARQPQHLVAERAELGGGGFGHAVEQRLVARLQDRDGGAEFVGDVGDQVAADLLLPVQGAGHLVEGGG